MAAERQQLKVVYAADSYEGDATSPCLACARVVDLGGGHFAVLARLTETKAPTCRHCQCALGFAGCTGRPRRGGFVVPACAACVDGLKTRVASYAGVGKERGLARALALIDESNAQNLTKKPLHESVATFNGGTIKVADAIYADAGKPGLAERVVTQIALQHQAPNVANALRALRGAQRRKRVLVDRKGGGGLKGRDLQRARSCARWDGRASRNLDLAGDAPLVDLDMASEATRDLWRGAVDESKEKDADERLMIFKAADAAEKLAASLAYAPQAQTRQTATRRADALAEHIRAREMQKAAEEASRSPEEEERLAEGRRKDALARSGVPYADQAGTDRHDGVACVENHRTRLDDRKKKARKKAKKRRKKARDESGLDPVQDAIKRKESATAKRLAAAERARNDDGSGRWVVCKREVCKKYGVPIMHYGAAFKKCPQKGGGCLQRMAVLEPGCVQALHDAEALYDEGILGEAEYKAKKKELLAAP